MKVSAIISSIILLAGAAAHAGQWTFDPESRLLSHSESNWTLRASAVNTSLSIDWVIEPPQTPATLPIADAVEDGFQIVDIGANAFLNCAALTSATLPSSITNVGARAFSGCTNLTSVLLGDGVANIGASSFAGCNRLAEFIFPDSVTNIGNYAFSGCSRLTRAVIPDSVLNIGNGAFSSCEDLSDVSIGRGVVKLGSLAFFGSNRLRTVEIRDRGNGSFLLNVNALDDEATLKRLGINIENLTTNDDASAAERSLKYAESEKNSINTIDLIIFILGGMVVVWIIWLVWRSTRRDKVKSDYLR